MATNNFIVTSLPAYVQENRDMLLKNFALVGTATRSRGISIQTGIKLNAYINYMEVDPTLQDGTDCGFSALGDIAPTQRTISTAAIKVNMDVCPRKLLGKYAEYLVRNNANEQDLPFEQYIMDGLIASINRKIEKLIWQGDKTAHSGDTDLKWIDGWLAIATDDAEVVDATIAAGSTAYQGILTVYALIPEEALERGAEIYVSPAIYRVFMQEMVQANYYHYSGPVEAAPQEFYLPGTDTRVVSTPGLAGDLHVLATFPRNLIYGTDMEGDEEDIKIWFSDDDDVFKVKVLWSSGVQFAYPGMVVLGAFSAAPTMPTGPVLNTIATHVASLDSAEKVFKTSAQE